MPSLLRLARPFAIAVALLWLISACTSSSTHSSAGSSSPSTDGAGGLLYVQRAAAATVTNDADGTVLHLTGVEPSMNWFTDRPARHAGTMTSASFVDGWSKEFGTDDPNAVVDIADPSLDDVTVKLHPISIDGSIANYRVVVDAGSKPFPSTMGAVSLFVDDGGLPGMQRQLTFTIGQMLPGQTIRFGITTPGSSFVTGGWSTPTVQLTSQQGGLPVVDFAVEGSNLALVSGNDGFGGVVSNVTIAVVVQVTSSNFTFDAEFDPGAMITVGSNQWNAEPVNVGSNTIELQ